MASIDGLGVFNRDVGSFSDATGIDGASTSTASGDTAHADGSIGTRTLDGRNASTDAVVMNAEAGLIDGNGVNGPQKSSGGGCSCNVADQGGSNASALLALLALAFGLVVNRKRARRR
jgi:hypothetical protein